MLRQYPFFIFLGLMLCLASCADVPRGGSSGRFSPAVSIKPGRSVTVLRGETLYAFARRNHASMREIIDVNRLQAPYVLAGGMSLKLPASDSDLPSVELGPVAAENEKEYKQKHKGKPVTTYTQVAPDSETQNKETSTLANVPRLAPPGSDVLKSELQTEANHQFAMSAKPEKHPENDTGGAAATSALNLKPMQFDEAHKHLFVGNRKPVAAPVMDKKQGAPAKPVADKYGKTTQSSRVPSDPNNVDVRMAAMPPKLNDVKEDIRPEPSPSVIDEPKKTEREMHSRIEKSAEPKNLIWPVQGTTVSTYGPKSNGLRNDGINIAVPRGTPVLAADGGTVAYAGSDIPGYGRVVLVRHPNGLMTTYAHLERMFVQENMVVAKGDLLGTVGNTGGVDTPQLHFEIRRDKEALDPSKYLYR